jgi:hypothetical protein
MRLYQQSRDGRLSRYEVRRREELRRREFARRERETAGARYFARIRADADRPHSRERAGSWR